MFHTGWQTQILSGNKLRTILDNKVQLAIFLFLLIVPKTVGLLRGIKKEYGFLVLICPSFPKKEVIYLLVISKKGVSLFPPTSTWSFLSSLPSRFLIAVHFSASLPTEAHILTYLVVNSLGQTHLSTKRRKCGSLHGAWNVSST